MFAALLDASTMVASPFPASSTQSPAPTNPMANKSPTVGLSTDGAAALLHHLAALAPAPTWAAEASDNGCWSYRVT